MKKTTDRATGVRLLSIEDAAKAFGKSVREFKRLYIGNIFPVVREEISDNGKIKLRVRIHDQDLLNYINSKKDFEMTVIDRIFSKASNLRAIETAVEEVTELMDKEENPGIRARLLTVLQTLETQRKAVMPLTVGEAQAIGETNG